MSKSKEETINDLVSSFATPPSVAQEEELAIKQTIQKLALKLSEHQGKPSILQEFPIDMIDNIAKKGQLTLVAENLDDSFLRSVESLVKTCPITFEAQNDHSRKYEKIPISETYELARDSLAKKMIKDPPFHDVLLRMYAHDGPFYKKMNAIVGGYDKDPKISQATSDDEIRLAFLLNVALHRAGLDKRSLEFQTTPDELFRGQSHGLEVFERKAEKLNNFYAEGKLANLSPAELDEINIVDVAAKKTLSASTSLDTTVAYTKTTGVVIHVKNPEEVADFYNIANISQYPDEAEFISRIPDDIVMLPARLYKDENHVSHIDVICIRSQSVLLQNSSLYKDTKDSLKRLIKETSEKIVYDNSGYLYTSLSSNAKEQLALLSTLEAIVNLSETELSCKKPEQQEEFLRMGYVLINKLYLTNLSAGQLQLINTINIKLQEFSGIFAKLNVLHEVRDLKENIAIEQNKIFNFLTGIKYWSAELAKKGNSYLLGSVKNDVDTLIELNSTNDIRDSPQNISIVRQTAEKIISTLQSDNALDQNLPGLKERMAEIIKSIDHIECCKKATPPPNLTAISDRIQSISSTQLYKHYLVNEVKEDGEDEVKTVSPSN